LIHDSAGLKLSDSLHSVMKTKVLFVCIHNSARSQMGEAFMNRYCGDEYEAQSAGLEPGTLNPLVVEAMAEEGIDLAQARTKSVAEMLERGERFDFAITVCDEANAERCPIFPGNCSRLHWSFPDPSQFQGVHDQKLAAVREVRDAIAQRICDWCEERCGVA
jgi:arsenate reductase (thioredoxin)